MNDQEILALYTQAYNQARQTGGGGQETPHQIAHVRGLQAIAAIGGGANGTISREEPLRVQPEDPAISHQRRLGFAAHWLNEAGRRDRIAASPTFTHVTDGFAAGGAYERAYLAGEVGAGDRAEHMLSVEENAVHEQLASSNDMQALLDDLHDIVGAETPDELVQTIQRWATSGGGEAAPQALPPVLNQPAEVELEPGNYAWCSCGRSANQPFCDGSHKGTEDQPLLLKIKKKATLKLCQCKQTGTPPYCDGSHAELVAVPASPAAPAAPATAAEPAAPAAAKRVVPPDADPGAEPPG